MTEPEPPGSPDPTPEVEERQAPHDPSGIELARSVAAQWRGDGARTDLSRPSRRRRAGANPTPAGRDDRDPTPLGSAVERLVEEHGWTTDVSVHSVLGRWLQIVGPEVAAHCEPTAYRDGVVTVVADSTAWATQLRLLAATVVARLNAELGDGTVARIEVVGPGGPSWRHGRRTVRGRGPRDTYG